MQVALRAPAKINLSLLVGPGDEGDYHELFTVFAPIDVYDELDFSLKAYPRRERGGGLQVKCRAVEGEANLVARALRAVERETGWAFGGTVVITKGIPMGAGLGGGSTDAAAALLTGALTVAESGGPAMNENVLRRLARDLGADVGFFLDGRPAIGRGIGDVLRPLTLPPLPIVLVMPEDHLSTASVYREFDLLGIANDADTFHTEADDAERLWRQWERSSSDPTPSEVARLLRNDLEEASFAMLPSLVEAKAALVREGALGALMSGSGPTLFGVCASAENAAECAEKLIDEGFMARPATAGGPLPAGYQGVGPP